MIQTEEYLTLIIRSETSAFSKIEILMKHVLKLISIEKQTTTSLIEQTSSGIEFNLMIRICNTNLKLLSDSD